MLSKSRKNSFIMQWYFEIFYYKKSRKPSGDLRDKAMPMDAIQKLS